MQRRRLAPYRPTTADIDPQWPLRNGLTGFWPLRDGLGLGARDFSAKKRHGTLSSNSSEGTPTWVVDRGRWVLQCGDSNYTDANEGGWVNEANSASAYLSTTAWTISCWVKLGTSAVSHGASKTTAYDGEGIVTFGSDSGGGVGIFRTTPAGGGTVDGIYGKVRPLSGPTETTIAVSSLPSSDWFHLLCVLEPNTGITHPHVLYLGYNGVLTAFAEVEANSFFGGVMKIGKGNARAFSGLVRDVLVWNVRIGDTALESLYAHPDQMWRRRRRVFSYYVPPPYVPGVFAVGEKMSCLIRIEGVGELAGQWGFGVEIPPYATDLGKKWLAAWPSSFAERITALGGIPETGELTAKLLDYGDRLTDKLRLDASPTTQLSSAVSATADMIPVYSSSALSENDVLFIDGEALVVTEVPDGTSFRATRGHLDTTPAVHSASAYVKSWIPYVRGRRMRLVVVPTDATDASQELEFGQYYLDETELEETNGALNAWIFRGRSQLKYLGRELAGQVPKYEVAREIPDQKTWQLNGVNPDLLSMRTLVRDMWPDCNSYMRIGDEIVRTIGIDGSGRFAASERALAGTAQVVHDAGEVASFVLLADPTYGSFRYSPGPALVAGATPATTRSDPAEWVVSSHWVDILLCILTSSAGTGARADGMQLANYNPAYGNWSSLPPGFGLGIPHALIDWVSFLAVRERTQHWIFPGFSYGQEPISFADLATKNFLRPLGAYLTTCSNVLRLVLPAAPNTSQDLVTFDNDVIKELKSPKHDNSTVVTTITVKHKTERGRATVETFNAIDNPALGAQSALYSNDEPALELEVPGVFSDTHGFHDFLREIAERRIFRFAKPPWRITVRTDLAQYATTVGDLVALSYSDLPDLNRGVRGWSGVVVEVLERTLLFSDEFLGFEWTLLGYGPSALRVGRVAPSARVSSVAGAGPYTATCRVNEYTEPVAVGDLPVTDCRAFAVGDVVGLISRAGVPFAGSATVTGVTDTTLDLDDHFGGSLAADTILVFDEYANAVSRQVDGFVYLADKTTRVLGDGAHPPWSYGEP